MSDTTFSEDGDIDTVTVPTSGANVITAICGEDIVLFCRGSNGSEAVP